jgi:predicted transcriptional regulator
MKLYTKNEFAKIMGVTNPCITYYLKQGYVKRHYFLNKMVFDDNDILDGFNYQKTNINAGDRRKEKRKVGKYFEENKKMYKKHKLGTSVKTAY